MATLGKLWAGHVYGTNLGNVFIELDVKDNKEVVGLLRFADAAYGLVVYSLTGTFDEALRLTGKPKQGKEGVEYGELTVEARLTPEGNLRGLWNTSIGSGGTFTAYPHTVDTSSGSGVAAPNIPEQLYTKAVTLGAVRVFGDDIKKIIEDVAQGFDGARPVVTYEVSGGSQVSKYAQDFLAGMPQLGKLTYFKVFVQQPEAHGINRTVTVEFSSFGINEVRVQGIHEPWVVGRANLLVRTLKAYQSGLISTYRKFGLNLNAVILFAMFIVVPELETWQTRAVFVIAIFVVLNLLVAIHSKLVPNASISASTVKPSLLSRIWPNLLSWLLAATAATAGAYLYKVLVDETASPPAQQQPQSAQGQPVGRQGGN
jgi:hypothetical protein